MRLGKEQALGYVEDTGYLENTGDQENTGYLENTVADSLPAREPAIGAADGMPLTAADEPSLTVS